MNRFEKIMPGDWLLFKSQSGEKIFPIKVYPLLIKNDIKRNPELFSFIPINENNLLINGFIKQITEETADYIYEENQNFQIHFDIRNENYYFLLNKTQFNINYIHELQHLMDLCGIDNAISSIYVNNLTKWA